MEKKNIMDLSALHWIYFVMNRMLMKTGINEVMISPSKIAFLMEVKNVVQSIKNYIRSD